MIKKIHKNEIKKKDALLDGWFAYKSLKKKYYLGKNKSLGRFAIFKLWYTWFDIKIGDQNEANKQG